MNITYTLGENLYINITNRCTCSCEFCIRRTTDHVAGSGSLWLEEEPDKKVILDEILTRNPDSFEEIVFCGFGEPTCRLDDMLWICRRLRSKTRTPIRVNTNGHASLIAGQDVAPRFKGLVDTVSISLNAPDAEKYIALCHPVYGVNGFFGMLDFAGTVKEYVPCVMFTVVDSMPKADIEACRLLAETIGVDLRVRQYTEDYDGEDS